MTVADAMRKRSSRCRGILLALCGRKERLRRPDLEEDTINVRSSHPIRRYCPDTRPCPALFDMMSRSAIRNSYILLASSKFMKSGPARSPRILHATSLSPFLSTPFTSHFPPKPNKTNERKTSPDLQVISRIGRTIKVVFVLSQRIHPCVSKYQNLRSN